MSQSSASTSQKWTKRLHQNLSRRPTRVVTSPAPHRKCQSRHGLSLLVHCTLFPFYHLRTDNESENSQVTTNALSQFSRAMLAGQLPRSKIRTQRMTMDKRWPFLHRPYSCEATLGKGKLRTAPVDGRANSPCVPMCDERIR